MTRQRSSSKDTAQMVPRALRESCALKPPEGSGKNHPTWSPCSIFTLETKSPTNRDLKQILERIQWLVFFIIKSFIGSLLDF